jgi:uncharacterized membrane protein
VPDGRSDAARRRADVFDYDRTVALSDGVFAIALTLLVLDIPRPTGDSDLWDQLGDLLPNFGAYALSFVVLAAGWRSHHTFFRGVKRIDGRLTTINLTYLALIALIPFPTGLIAERGDESAAVILYAFTIAAFALLGAAMRVHASRAGLSDDPPRPLYVYLAVPAVFLLSIPIAAVSPAAAMYSWLSLILVARIAERAERRAG